MITKALLTLMAVASLTIATNVRADLLSERLSALRATCASSDYGKRHPGEWLNNVVVAYYNQAMEIRESQHNAVDLEIYVNIQEKLAEEGLGPGLTKNLIYAIIDRAAQNAGTPEISWSEIHWLVEKVVCFLHENGHSQNSVNEILKAPAMRRSQDWIKNYFGSEPVATPTLTQ